MSQRKQYDIIIVGGGMVGATLACALGKTGLKIAVLESATLPRWSEDQFDQRVSAITRASQCFLDNVGVWEKIQARRVSAFREMHVWDATGQGEIHFDSAQIGEPDMGHIVENTVIQLAARERMQELETVSYINPARAQSLDVVDERVVLTLENDIELEAALLVGADGGNSWVRKQSGIDVSGWSYDQKAVVTTVKTALPHKETAWQRFLPTGPLAFLPLAGNYSSIVWSATIERAEQLLELDDDAFKMELESAFDGKLGEIQSVTQRTAFALKLQHANSYVAKRTVLVGDAAHTVHPLAGQGVNLGFMDAATLAQVIADKMQSKSGRQADIGSRTVLRRYERWRKADNVGMLAGMDVFKKLFGNNAPVLRWARNTGLTLTNNLVPLKSIIMRNTMGLSGDLPGLARSVSKIV